MRILASISVSAFCLSLLALLAATRPAAANATAAQLSAIKANCRSDYISKCWDVPKGAKAFQCLKDHMAKLSSGCQQAVKATIPAPPPAPAAAKPETAPPAPAPSTATAKPAAPATTETSPPAQEAKTAPATAPNSTPATPPKAASEPPAKHAQAEAPAESAKAPAAASAEMPPIIGFLPPRMKLMVLRNCHHDLETYCADVPFGEGRNLRCLFGHKAALTPNCQGVLARLTH